MFKAVNKGVSSVLESQTLGWVVVIGGVFLGWRLIRKTGGLIGGVKTSIDKLSWSGKIQANTPGFTNDIYDKGYKIASAVSDAFGTNPNLPWYSKMTEDEDAAIFELNKIDSQPLGSVVKQVYEKISGFGLWFHVEKYMFSWQIRSINSVAISYIR